jgi:hypothetical protein
MRGYREQHERRRRQRWLLSKPEGHGAAFLAWKMRIKDDHIKGLSRLASVTEGLKGCGATLDEYRTHRPVAQKVLHNTPLCGVVVHDEHLQAGQRC